MANKLFLEEMVLVGIMDPYVKSKVGSRSLEVLMVSNRKTMNSTMWGRLKEKWTMLRGSNPTI